MRHYYICKVHALHRSRIFNSHMATLAEVDQSHQSVHFLPLTVQLALIFYLKHYSYILLIQHHWYTVNNSKPKEWHF